MPQLTLSGSSVLGAMVAALPGVIVALVSSLLVSVRQRSQVRMRRANARALIALEFDDNRLALDRFWKLINQLDPQWPGDDPLTHLTALAAHGLLAYSLPEWSYVRWNAFAPEYYGAFQPKELTELDQAYRDLRAVADTYAKLVTLTPQEQAAYAQDPQWAAHFAHARGATYLLLAQAVERVLAAQPIAGMKRLSDPLSPRIRQEQPVPQGAAVR